MRQLVTLAAALAIAAGQGYIGRLDTIGGTTYDWWADANVRRSLVNSPQFGVHAVWMSSSSSGTSFPDCCVRYNYYDHSVHAWNWLDDCMSSGVNVFTERTGYGVVAADSSGKAIVVAHNDSGLVLARDAAPGVGIFSYSHGPSGYYWPDIAIGDDSVLHVAMSSGTGVSYSRLTGSSSWDSVRVLDSLAYLTYAIAASRTGPAVFATWVGDTAAFCLLSENRGDTWSSRVRLDPPPAFGGDTVTRFSRQGLFPFFDSQGRLHLTATVYPEVHDTAYVNPAEVWHWCQANQPRWARIHHAGCAPEHMQASVGYGAIYADRPTMGEGDDGELYVAWEQFDSSNVEPQTERLRAGVWVSGSADNGASWTPGLLVTERNTMSHRFPCIIDRVLSGEPVDTICVLYLMDQVAGFFIYNEGPATPNPVVCQFVFPPDAIGEEAGTESRAMNLGPTVVRGVLSLPRSLLTPHCSLLSTDGRKVLDLHPGANDVSRLAPGVYFVRLSEDGNCLTRKLVLAK